MPPVRMELSQPLPLPIEVSLNSLGHCARRSRAIWLLTEQSEDLDRARELAQRASRIEPSANTFDTLDWVQLRRGELAAAVASFEKALAETPGAASIRYHLGLALEASGDSSGALNAYRQAIASKALPEADAVRIRIAQLEKNIAPSQADGVNAP